MGCLKKKQKKRKNHIAHILIASPHVGLFVQTSSVALAIMVYNNVTH